nr:hypothetical protein [Tessaracoccus defluvii]
MGILGDVGDGVHGTAEQQAHREEQRAGCQPRRHHREAGQQRACDGHPA